MKIVAKPIEMIAWFTTDGVPNPIRFRMEEEKALKVINVDKIVFREKEKIAGSPAIIFNCQSKINGVMKLYQLKFHIDSCKWILFKI